MKGDLNNMTHNFLFEIGMEELPSRVILSVEKQFKENIKSFLEEVDLSYDTIEIFTTPRRIAAIIKGLPDKQADKFETVKGPSKKIALDDEGNWSKAAIGFSKGQGKSVDDIIFKDVNGEEYIFIEKHEPGKDVAEVLKDIPSVAKKLNFPVSMKWGRRTDRYIRPVHTLITLLDDEVVQSSFFDVESGTESLGHRFLGNNISIKSVDDYETALKKEFVIADRQKRQQLIIDQINDLCTENNWESPLYNQDLLDEVTDLVEYPTVFYGNFDEAFLDVPEQILETSMADHQRYFPVRSKEGQFLPYFIGVRNGDDNHLENVVKGNEKVLIARLEDAKFFYEEDKKHSIDEFVEKLNKVTYHEKLGSMVDKQKRVESIIDLLAKEILLDQEVITDTKAAAYIYKFDLVTAVVNEFSTLQGYIGSVYAAEQGVKDTVAVAIGEQYLPTSSGGALPETKVGAILSLSDKLESLMMFFSIGLVPTGSNDPFALRRAAYGLIRIIEANRLSFDLHDLFCEMANVLEIKDHEFIKDLELFIRERINQYLKDQHDIAYDIRQAAISARILNPTAIINQAIVLAKNQNTTEYKLVAESLSRVANLAEKVSTTEPVDIKLSQSESEKALIDQTKILKDNFIETKEASKRYEALEAISPKIVDFFDNNMVNTEDESVKANRYALLNEIHNYANSFADFNQLVTK